MVREWWFELGDQESEYFSIIVRMVYGVVREWYSFGIVLDG